MTIELFQMEKLSRDEREQMFYAIVSVLGRPLSFIEIGCGDGWLVRAAWQLMARPALGIALERPDTPWARRVIVRDYTRPLYDIRGRYALVLALAPYAHLGSAESLVATRGHLVVPHARRFESTKLEFVDDATRRLATSGLQLEVFECRD